MNNEMRKFGKGEAAEIVGILQSIHPEQDLDQPHYGWMGIVLASIESDGVWSPQPDYEGEVITERVKQVARNINKRFEGAGSPWRLKMSGRPWRGIPPVFVWEKEG